MEILLKDLASENALIKHWVVSWGIQTFIAFWNVLQLSRRILFNEFGYLADECLWLDNLIYCVEMWKKHQGADCEDPIKGQIEIRLKKGDAPKCFHDFVYGNYSSQILPSKKFLRRSKNKIWNTSKFECSVILKVSMMKSQTLTNFSFWFDNKVLTF